jgi:hypothetical protein
MSELALYEATRGVWKVGPKRDRVRYALAVYAGIVRAAYEIIEWRPANSDTYQTRSLEDVDRPGRWEFVGQPAPEAVRRRYVGKSVKQVLTAGSSNPITYVNID